MFTRSNTPRALLAVAVTALQLHRADAEQFGLFTYTVLFEGTVEIAGYPWDAVGHVEIPAEIDGRPVTSIGECSFEACTGLTTVTIPGSITRIAGGASSGCTSLTSAIIPDSVTRIGEDVFEECSRLTTITIPENVTRIGYGAFRRCSRLTSVVFLGDAPDLYGWPDDPRPVFGQVAPGFSVYYLSGSSGFTSPTWSPQPGEEREYPTAMLDSAPDDKQTWLLGQSLPLDTDLNEDPDGDGFPLLLAYALDLDPGDLEPHLPAPVVDGGNLTLSFYGDRTGITYTAQTSTDLKTWTTDGVALTGPGPDGKRTASVARDGDRFLRVAVAEQ